MDNINLQKLVEEISLNFFRKSFQHRALFNPRLRTVGGRYLLANHNIEINKKYYDLFGETELIGIIKHELCHYHLHLEGKGFRHRDSDFKKLLKKVGAPRHCTPLPEEKKRRRVNKTLIYSCIKCSQKYQRKRALNTSKYVCGKCKGELVMIKELTEN